MKTLVFGDHSEMNPDTININLFPAKGVDLVYDAIRLPIKDNSFDVLISNQVMEHYFHIKEFYAEAARVLKPWGYMDVSFPHRFVPYDSHARKWFKHWIFPNHHSAYYFNWKTKGYHRRLAEKYFVVVDRSSSIVVDYSIYEGPKVLRWLAEFVPFIGYFRQVHWRLIKEMK